MAIKCVVALSLTQQAGIEKAESDYVGPTGLHPTYIANYIL